MKGDTPKYVIDIKEYDMIRQIEIESRNIKVLRIKNEDIYNDLESFKRIRRSIKLSQQRLLKGIQFVSPDGGIGVKPKVNKVIKERYVL